MQTNLINKYNKNIRLQDEIEQNGLRSRFKAVAVKIGVCFAPLDTVSWKRIG
jgi:hypothetical protein